MIGIGKWKWIAAMVAAFNFAGAAMAIEVKPPKGFYAEGTIDDRFQGTWCEVKGKELFANPITYKRCGKGAKSRVVIEDRKITRYYSDGEPNRHYGEVIGTLHDLTAAAGLFVAVKSGAFGGKDIAWLKGGRTGPKRLPTDTLTIQHNVKEPRPNIAAPAVAKPLTILPPLFAGEWCKVDGNTNIFGRFKKCGEEKTIPRVTITAGPQATIAIQAIDLPAKAQEVKTEPVIKTDERRAIWDVTNTDGLKLRLIEGDDEDLKIEVPR